MTVDIAVQSHDPTDYREGHVIDDYPCPNCRDDGRMMALDSSRTGETGDEFYCIVCETEFGDHHPAFITITIHQ